MASARAGLRAGMSGTVQRCVAACNCEGLAKRDGGESENTAPHQLPDLAVPGQDDFAHREGEFCGFVTLYFPPGP
jgi:hypothetical protein